MHGRADYRRVVVHIGKRCRKAQQITTKIGRTDGKVGPYLNFTGLRTTAQTGLCNGPEMQGWADLEDLHKRDMVHMI